MADANARASSATRKAECVVCGTPFQKVTSKKYCSEDCRKVKLREQQLLHYHTKVRSSRIVEDKTTPCLGGCGVRVEYVTNKRVYCEACRLSAVRKTARGQQRRYRLERKADRDYAAAERARLRQYRIENKNRLNAKEVERKKEKYSSDPVFAIAVRIRSRIGNALRKNGLSKKSRTLDILGCGDWDEFKRHIERQFLRGMSWANRDKWHIDHIVPLDSAATEEDVLALNHYTNLRPMWASDNIRKHKRITHLL